MEHLSRGCHRGPPRPWRSLFGYRQVWALIAARFFTDPIWWFLISWLPNYLKDERGFSLALIGLLPFALWLAVVLLQIFTFGASGFDLTILAIAGVSGVVAYVIACLIAGGSAIWIFWRIQISAPTFDPIHYLSTYKPHSKQQKRY